MDCLLMRHGLAVNMEKWSGSDETRPLLEQGKQNIRRVAEGLAMMGLAPTYILTSPFTRAMETAALVRQILCPSIPLAISTTLKPGASS